MRPRRSLILPSRMPFSSHVGTVHWARYSARKLRVWRRSLTFARNGKPGLSSERTQSPVLDFALLLTLAGLGRIRSSGFPRPSGSTLHRLEEDNIAKWIMGDWAPKALKVHPAGSCEAVIAIIGSANGSMLGK